MTSTAGPPRLDAVLVDITDAAVARRVARALAGSELTIADAAQAGVGAEVVVSDQAHKLAARRLAAPDPGLLLIGGEHPAADARLPASFTKRELLLACHLLAKLAHCRSEALRTAAAGRTLDRLAHTDALTQLANRRAWNLELARRLEAAHSAGAAVALAMFDVDHFKRVNDELGHAAGDAALVAVAHRLTESLRPSDLVARLGGDEFGLLLTGSFDLEAATQIVERVRQGATQSPPVSGQRPLTLSAGCAVASPGTMADPAALFDAADRALAEAKQAGRDRTAIVAV